MDEESFLEATEPTGGEFSAATPQPQGSPSTAPPPYSYRSSEANNNVSSPASPSPLSQASEDGDPAKEALEKQCFFRQHLARYGSSIGHVAYQKNLEVLPPVGHSADEIRDSISALARFAGNLIPLL